MATPSSTNPPRLRVRLALRGVLALTVMMAMLFLPAGTFDYWEAWVYLGLVFALAAGAGWWLFRHSPQLLVRRMRMREPTGKQVKIVSVAGVVMIAAFVLPGFDHRWGWSQVPIALVIGADVVVLASYLFVFQVQRVNEFASRVVEVEQGHRVVDTGPYAIVRHPMYLGMMWFILATPVALGSYWALIPALGIVPALMARILAEEELLRRDLPGYVAYTGRVHHRLLPGIW
ncbi:MAG TPA: isoprenylcysteine carboxylmethyltransferase family protein [Propionicimonas sp.]|nr:isoprenylcysteine carboxylmethyltransferase family protein [Propionicimonas sp.]